MHGLGTMFDKILKFEQELAEFTGAPYAIMTDCCTHAIELCLRHERVREVVMTPYTYISIPMTMHKLGIKYYYKEEEWCGEYRFHGTRIWDSARRLEWKKIVHTVNDRNRCTPITLARDKPIAQAIVTCRLSKAICF